MAMLDEEKRKKQLSLDAFVIINLSSYTQLMILTLWSG